jgi:hypothetical protein
MTDTTPLLYHRLLPPQRLALDFQLADAAFDLVKWSGHGVYFDAEFAGGMAFIAEWNSTWKNKVMNV